ncbi:MAG: glycosyltransferase 61 family protein, partial [Pseudomonadota bacterium]|nr:glycosyltransferase 61 family protein [Pseudomonadota bacterium]
MIVLEEDENTLVVPESRLFLYPTKVSISSLYPRIKEVILPETKIQKKLETEKTFNCNYRVTFENRKNKRGKFNQLKKFFKNPIKSDGILIDIRDECYNIAHFLIRIIPHAFIVKEEYKDFKFILSPRVPKYIIELLQFVNIPFVLTNDKIEGNIITLASKEKSFHYFLGYFKIIYSKSKLMEEEKRAEKEKCIEKVFISRKKTRKLVNEAEIEEFLKKKGFYKYYFE